MSRTDVHRPVWVLERDPHMRRDFVPRHNHTTGPCDLDGYLSARGWTRTRCRLEYVGARNIYCGCHLCTGQPGRKLARRQERGWWRNTRAQLLAAVDREEVDVTAVRGKAW